MRSASREKSPKPGRRRRSRGHALQALRGLHWIVVAGLWVAAFWLGYIGFAHYFALSGSPRSIGDLVYLSLQLFVLESGAVASPAPWPLEIARLLAPAIAGYTAIRALAALFREQLGRLRLRFLRGHVLVVGLGRKGLLLARTLRERGERVIAVERNEDNEHVAACRSARIPVVIGDARQARVLESVRVERAARVIAVCGSDGVNAEILTRISGLCRRSGRRGPACLAHIVDTHLCRLLRRRELSRSDTEPRRIDFFNVFESGASAMLSIHPIRADASRDGIVVIGLQELGENVVSEAIRHWSWGDDPVATPLRVVIVDPQAHARTESLLIRRPLLRQTARLEPHQMALDSPEFRRAEFLFDENGTCPIAGVYVCVHDDSAGLAAALQLHQRLHQQLPREKVAIIVAMTHDEGLATLLSDEEAAADHLARLCAFGLLMRTCDPELLFAGTIEKIARAIHADYLRQARLRNESFADNPSAVEWHELDESLRESNRLQALHIGAKLTAIGCELDDLVEEEPEAFCFTGEELEQLARMEHDRWLEEKRATGWQYAPAPKNPELKTSPDMLPWQQLPESSRQKDRHAVIALPRLLASAGFSIVRRERNSRS
ncbi:MAG: NAD-binding protein [Acidobacteriota bacterium]|nr:MAG: NAD-binding protein [Acidobacteriota bacterium]